MSLSRRPWGPLTPPAAPTKAAVLDLVAIDTLLALGVTPAAVPGKLYLDHLQPLAGKAAPVGALQEPDLEKLAAAGPGLIVVANRSAVKKDAVAQVAPAIDMTVDGAKLIADSKARLAGFAALFGKKAEGQRLSAALDEKLAALSAAGKDKGTALIVLTNGPKTDRAGTGRGRMGAPQPDRHRRSARTGHAGPVNPVDSPSFPDSRVPSRTRRCGPDLPNRGRWSS